MRHYHQLILSVIFCSSMMAQSALQMQAEKVEFTNSYKKAWAIMSETENYSFKMRYLSFEDYTTGLASESASGYYMRSGNSYKSNIMGIKTIQNNIVKLSIDSVDKLMILSNPDKISFLNIDMEKLDELLENAKKVSMRKDKNAIVYKIDFEPNALYESYELKLNENGIPIQITFFYSTIRDKDYEESIQGKDIVVKPRLEIHFDDFKELAKVKEADFSENLYVMVDANGVKKSERYKNYALKDYRIKK